MSWGRPFRSVLVLVVATVVVWGVLISFWPVLKGLATALFATWPWLVVAALIVGALVFFGRQLFIFTFRVVNVVVPWFRLPSLLGALNLDAFRFVLRDENLHDVPFADLEAPEWDPKYKAARSADGSFNDLSDPNMGRAGARFGRNFPLASVVRSDQQKLMHPNPRDISRLLMTRDYFKPAESLNLLAAAWIQFMVHGWVNHKQIRDQHHEIPLSDDDSWPQHPMRVRKSRPDSPETAEHPATFANSEPHWWDASQLYGNKMAKQIPLRALSGGKLKLHLHQELQELRLPADSRYEGIDETGFNDNYWMGLSLFHTVFAMEHNAICDRLATEFPAWDDQRLFDTARLVNCALMAKIHTVEWTPGILAHPTLRVSMDANWWGLFGERISRALGRLSDREEISGIMGSPADHHSASYTLTEEFTSVYRLHALIPDEYEFFSTEGKPIRTQIFHEIEGNNTRPSMNDMRLSDMVYSFGIAHPGAVTLHNFPTSLQNLTRLDGQRLDLAAVDILRDRERGVPRYNEFRRLCHMKPVRSFGELCANPAWAAEIERVYGGKIEDVDLMVGLYAESPPPGFGFSDTAFRIFILMASRRLKSDRFFTDDYTPAVYTQAGLDWINDNTMSSVFVRHMPDLAAALVDVKNPFAPWKPVSDLAPLLPNPST